MSIPGLVSNLIPLSLLYKAKRITPSQWTKAPPSAEINDKIFLIRQDITKLRVDAIVSAANERLNGGAGVDGTIHRIAGPELLRECLQLGGCRTGSAKMTKAYDLPCKRVIHAVGPIYGARAPEVTEILLADCYKASLKLAAQERLASIAFPAISTGIYRFPSRDAARIASEAVRSFLEEDEEGKFISQVVFCCFEEKDENAYKEMLPIYFPPTPDLVKSTADNNSKGDPQSSAAGLEAALPSAPTTEPSSSKTDDLSDDQPDAKRLKPENQDPKSVEAMEAKDAKASKQEAEPGERNVALGPFKDSIRKLVKRSRQSVMQLFN